jgi:hypothetical protein
MLPGLTHAIGGFRSWLWLQFIATVLMTAERARRPPVGGVLQDFRAGAGALMTRAERSALPLRDSQSDRLRGIADLFSASFFPSSDCCWSRTCFATPANPAAGISSRCAWHAGALFAYDLFVFAEALIPAQRRSFSLFGARHRPCADGPALIVTMVRNEDWRIDIHVSRRVVFHTATLTAAGFSCWPAAGAASMLGQIQGQWGIDPEGRFLLRQRARSGRGGLDGKPAFAAPGG